MSQKKEYPVGIYFNQKLEKQPDFILGKISINKEKLMEWLAEKETNENGYIYLDVLQGRERPYCVVNNWKFRKKQTSEEIPSEDSISF